MSMSSQVLPASNLVGRRLDKRKERQLAAELQQAMKESLFKAVSGATINSTGFTYNGIRPSSCFVLTVFTFPGRMYSTSPR